MRYLCACICLVLYDHVLFSWVYQHQAASKFLELFFGACMHMYMQMQELLSLHDGQLPGKEKSGAISRGPEDGDHNLRRAARAFSIARS